LGDLSGEFLDSKRVVPAVAAEQGFPFHFAHLDDALNDLLG
jgi:NAD dependent epimerase/dehydratase family enzyme